MTEPKQQRGLLRLIIITGSSAAALDILAAFLQGYISNVNITPERILRYIASALVGKNAAAQGYAMPLLGLLLHTLIAMLWVSLFFLVCTRYPGLVKKRANAAVSALLYAVLIWAVMNRIVLPAAFGRPFPFEWEKALVATGILVVAISMPAVYAARWYLGTRPTTA